VRPSTFCDSKSTWVIVEGQPGFSSFKGVVCEHQIDSENANAEKKAEAGNNPVNAEMAVATQSGSGRENAVAA